MKSFCATIVLAVLSSGRPAYAQVPATPLFEADCKDLAAIPLGSGSRPLPPSYANIRVRRRGADFELTMHDQLRNGIRATLIEWDPGVRQHVARFAGGENWSVLGNAQGGLVLQMLNYFTNCDPVNSTTTSASSAKPALFPTPAPYSPPSPSEIERIWRAVQDAASTCGNGLAQDGL